ncbi:MAG: hypothetical protein HEEMFOPI_01066 [Holosporales bacterium]
MSGYNDFIRLDESANFDAITIREIGVMIVMFLGKKNRIRALKEFVWQAKQIERDEVKKSCFLNNPHLMGYSLRS